MLVVLAFWEVTHGPQVGPQKKPYMIPMNMDIDGLEDGLLLVGIRFGLPPFAFLFFLPAMLLPFLPLGHPSPSPCLPPPSCPSSFSIAFSLGGAETDVGCRSGMTGCLGVGMGTQVGRVGGHGPPRHPTTLPVLGRHATWNR